MELAAAAKITIGLLKHQAQGGRELLKTAVISGSEWVQIMVNPT